MQLLKARHQVRPESLYKIFEPAHASSKVKYEEKLNFENYDFRLHFSQAEHFLTKNTINTPAINNKRLLIADVFHL